MPPRLETQSRCAWLTGCGAVQLHGALQSLLSLGPTLGYGEPTANGVSGLRHASHECGALSAWRRPATWGLWSRLSQQAQDCSAVHHSEPVAVCERRTPSMGTVVATCLGLLRWQSSFPKAQAGSTRRPRVKPQGWCSLAWQQQQRLVLVQLSSTRPAEAPRRASHTAGLASVSDIQLHPSHALTQRRLPTWCTHIQDPLSARQKVRTGEITVPPKSWPVFCLQPARPPASPTSAQSFLLITQARGRQLYEAGSSVASRSGAPLHR